MPRPILPALLVLAGCNLSGAEPTQREATVRVPLTVAARAAPAPAEPIAAAVPEPPLAWTHAVAARAVWLARGNGLPLLALSCEGWERGAARLVVVRYAPAERGARALFAIQGSKGVLRLPVSAARVGARGWVWRGVLEAGDPRAEVLLGEQLKATVPGGGELLLPPLGEAAAVVQNCIPAAAPPPA